MGFIRARTDAEIASRQAEIINACDALYSRYGYEGVHFKAISTITTFKRSTIYSYYKTKDEVLLDLLKREMLDWVVALRKKFDKTEAMTKKEFSAFLAGEAASREKMLELLSILTTMVENQCRTERLALFKQEAWGVMETILGGLEKYFPGVPPEKRQFFKVMFMTCIHGLFPLTHLTQRQIEATKIAGKEYVPIDFKETLYKAILLLLADCKKPVT
jgi:AcrR family transcriptional regulator